MQIIINVSDKDIKAAVENMIDGNIYENYGQDVLKLAGVPKKATLVKAVLADEKFMAGLSKEIASRFDANDYLYDAVWDIKCKPVLDFEDKCDKAYEQAGTNNLEKEAAAEVKRKEAEEAATVARVIAILEKNGYKLTKE